MEMDSGVIAKKAAAEKACELVKDGMTVGLGTGSTAEWAIKCLGERVRKEGLEIVGVPSSKKTQRRWRKSPAWAIYLDLNHQNHKLK